MPEPPPPPRRPGTPLIDRPVHSQPPTQPHPADTPTTVLVPPARRHVWIAPVDRKDTTMPHPGILHAWRHDSDGWQARCTYVVDDGTPEGVTITQWLAATAIRPA